jgi:uncharacterized damage-inducible protein DinB
MTNKEFFIQTWQNEMKPTLRAINGLPTDMSKLSYKCNEKARSAAEIIGHMLGHAEVLNDAVDSSIADEKSIHREFSTKQEAVAYFEENATSLVKKLHTISDNTWEDQIISFRLDGKELYTYPMINTFWTLLFDMIHHRGQLSTYYRNMGVRNPQIYGPTAEDMEAMLATHA